jgi:hypothetical protein
MSDALINCFDRDEAKVLTPPKRPPRALVSTNSIHHELRNVKFPKFFGAPNGVSSKEWLQNMEMLFSLHDYTSNMKVHMAVF